MQRLSIILLISVLCQTVLLAQNTSTFDYTVRQLEENSYEFTMSIGSIGEIQFMEIGFLDSSEQDIANESYVVSINKKADDKYYLFHNDKEYAIDLNNFTFYIQRENLPEIHAFDSSNKSVYVISMNKDFEHLNKYQQIITF